jgi:hypothetical protein
MNELIPIIENYDLEKFYTVTLWQESVDLQGYAKKEIIDYCISLGFVFKFEDGNWLKATRGRINITLTF